MDEILENESYRVALSCGTVYYTVQAYKVLLQAFASAHEILK